MIVATLMAAAVAGAPAKADPRVTAVVSELRQALDLYLNDYPTARFQKVRLAFTPGGHKLVCGLVNAKGVGGGYAGWEAFYSDRPADQPLALKAGHVSSCDSFSVDWLPTDLTPAVSRGATANVRR